MIFTFQFRQLPPVCQMMLFSATYDRSVMEFAQHIVKNPIVIKLMREQESLDNIIQYYVRCRDQDEKYQAIQNIYGVITIGQAIIFCHVISILFYALILRLRKEKRDYFVLYMLTRRHEKQPVGYHRK